MSMPTPPALSDMELQTLQVLLADVLPAVPGQDFPACDVEMLNRHLVHPSSAFNDLKAMLAIVQAAGADRAYQTLPATERMLVLVDTRRHHLRLFSNFFVTAIQCYCLDPRVRQALGDPLRAPFPDGYAVSDGSFELLAAVYDRGPCYRPC